MNRRPRALLLVSFIGGCSFLGFHFLPSWLMAPLFFLTPAIGPLLLLIAGVLSMRRARMAEGASSALSRMLAAALASCVTLLVPIAAADFLLFGALPYIGLLLLVIAVPYHVVCAGTFVAGLYALVRVNDRSAVPLIVAAAAGVATGITLAVVRIEVVPRSRGVFLHAFSGSGASLDIPGRPLDRYGQREIAETLGVQPRRYHEPVAAIGDDAIWFTQRSRDGSCSGYWIERKGFAPGAPGWRRCSVTPLGRTRNPTAIALDGSGRALLVGFDVGDDGKESVWLARYDDGLEQVGIDSPHTTLDRSYAVRPSSDDAFYIAGESGENDSRGTSGWVRKFDSNLHEVRRDGWPLRFPNAGERRPTMAAIATAVDSAGDVFVLLDLYNAYSVRKFDTDGRELWQKDLPGHRDLAIAAGADGELFVSGTSNYPDQAWIRKLKSDGSDEWEKTFALGHLSSALAVAVDADRAIYVAGYGTEPDDKASYWWIKNLGPDGVERWHRTLSGPEPQNAPFQLHVKAPGEIYALGNGNGWQFSGSLLERYWGW